uniref:Uncharacterized protein n=1 Tax=Ananas comosus var. bracteatus TaxID=296719 RepID=A0A6V7QQD9_ANACO|nr:unnamed protein product [Ananas comosus var. bracteatus]
MSLNQSRAEKSEGFRKPGRSGGSSQHHRGFSGVGGGGKGGGGGGGGGGSAPPPPLSSNTYSATPSSSSSVPPALYSNRSLKKSGNGPGNQPRLNPTSTNIDGGSAIAHAAHGAVQNGAHAHAPTHAGPSDAPATAGAKPVDVPVPRNPPRPLPKAPPSQSAAGAPDSSSPSTPAKGDSSRAFTLQFGSISPGS